MGLSTVGKEFSMTSFDRLAASAALMIGAAVPAAGCAVDSRSPQSSDGTVSTSHQAFSSIGWYSWGGTMNGDGTAFTDGVPVSLTIPLSTTGYSCMLTGVLGDLSHGSGLGASIDNFSGHWTL